jgi:hypothetical protein
MSKRIAITPGVEGAPGSRSWVLRPSDFAFLWEECRRCFYLDLHGISQRPRTPFPKIFTAIDGQMKAGFMGRRLTLPGCPGAVVAYQDLWVESAPIAIPGHAMGCVVRGRLDTVLEFDDGSYAVIDFKTSAVRDEHVPKYSRQLHAYAHCLERPAPGKRRYAPVSQLGLLVFEPTGFRFPARGTPFEAVLGGSLHWLAMPRDEAAFLAFLAAVLDVLEGPPPPPAPTCQFCAYSESMAPDWAAVLDAMSVPDAMDAIMGWLDARGLYADFVEPQNDDGRDDWQYDAALLQEEFGGRDPAEGP